MNNKVYDVQAYTPIAKKRAMLDYKKYMESELKELNHIYCIANESNIFNFKAMIVGPKDTPYECGYYFFDITLPPNYPFECPSVKYYTQGDGTRFHPNLYTNGKVCLSILGTWAGPRWTAIMNLSSLLISIQGLLDDNPIRNEPGYEKESNTGTRASSYIQLLKYQNIKTSVIKMINDTPPLFTEFKPDMLEEFKLNYKYFDKYIKTKMNKNGNVINSGIYGLSTVLDIKTLESNIKDLKKKFKIEL